MSEAEAEKFRGRFFSGYPDLARWHQAIKTAASYETRTLSGRRRQWKDTPALTELYNTPIQGTSADITKKALALLSEALKGTGAKIIGTVHDEIILEVPQDRAQSVKDILSEIMIHAGQYFLKKVPVEVDVRIADSWAKE